MELPAWIVLGGAIGGLISTWCGILYLLYRVIGGSKAWVTTEVVEPYMQPIKADLDHISSTVERIESAQTLHNGTLSRHEADINLLKGKVETIMEILTVKVVP